MRKRPIEDVIKDIIELGNRLHWFVKFIGGNKIESYIQVASPTCIEIDMHCLREYMRDPKKYSDSELWDYLIEIITKVVPGASDYLFEEGLPF